MKLPTIDIKFHVVYTKHKVFIFKGGENYDIFN